ncbi:dienelactone hydrolase family protein [Lindgomyces ingoldianus]|uniref:Dienelactone hydrolase family protein n=1 Tax=Lindgomyces ingoldianus TaxID=673940 RepID=A0ACB6QTD6_9PLEO|nr:dienelactone hydrolase family protein [Lindgomyces ingoldianus]KAF2470102.1 dienelactone hydrolase family protein [Lindgomyces ingoldianus]
MSSQCCVAGEIHQGTPTGKVAKVHGLDCYVAEPAQGVSPKGVIVILPDVFGWELSNNRILADNYAQKGEWLVYLPEFMAGGLSALWHLLKCIWYIIPFRIATRPSVMRPRIFNFFHALRKDEAAHIPLGAAGFCWGGKWSTILAWNTEQGESSDKPLVDATYTAHPSQLTIPSDIQKIQKPTSIAAGALDKRYPKSQVDETEAILRAKMEKGEGEHEVVWYEGARHGFAVRGSQTDPVENEKGMQAEEQAVGWFRKIFAMVED